MNRSSLPQSVNTLKKWYESENKILQCTLPFQRHSGMWNIILRSNLIWSMLSDFYIPPIVLLKDKSGVDAKGKETFSYQILEEQQRIVTTLIPFMNDEWALHGSLEPVEYDGFSYDIAGKKFSELEDELKDAIKGYRFTIQCLENYTYEEAERLYYLINSGVSLSAMQKGKAKLGTELMEFLNKLLEGDFFSQAINITMKQALAEDDLLMLMQGMALLDARDVDLGLKNISAATMLNYVRSIRGTYTQEKRESLSEVVGFLDRAFPAKSKFLRRNNVPIVFVMAKIALEQEIEAEAFRAFITYFADSISPAYEMSSGSGNVKIANVNMRLRAMFLAMCEYFGWNAEEVKKPFDEDLGLYEGLAENAETEAEAASLKEEPPAEEEFHEPQAQAENKNMEEGAGFDEDTGVPDEG